MASEKVEVPVVDDHGLAQFDFGFFDDTMFDDDDDDEIDAPTKRLPTPPPQPYDASHREDGWFHVVEPLEIPSLFATKNGPNQLRNRMEHDYLHENYRGALDTALEYLRCVEEQKGKPMAFREISEIAARSALKLKEYSTAVDCAERLGKTNEAGHHLLRYEVYLAAGHPLSAIEHCLNYLSLRRRDPNVWRKMGNAFAMLHISDGNLSKEDPKPVRSLVAHPLARRCFILSRQLIVNTRWPSSQMDRREKLLDQISNEIDALPDVAIGELTDEAISKDLLSRVEALLCREEASLAGPEEEDDKTVHDL